MRRRGRAGTAVTFRPDATIFKAGVGFDFETLATRFDEQAYLNAGLNITMRRRAAKEAKARRLSSMRRRRMPRTAMGSGRRGESGWRMRRRRPNA